ncbi:MAG TPA: hypothetical protein DDX39_02005 [Bacteroidales bacterium]|nr:MAG: hypothetical protein A2W98_08625 [Bacteroidetes bacterium GWF2_33_38]OFY74070.1 MAG: hypothetical protein A2265_09490 [Bacteroidetes bacterium RIFOXYA12_FULL_33_9]HBF87387.1 hypothetical protein [Bacteroidales bacterium]
MKKIFITTIIIIFCLNLVYSQNWIWAKQGECSGTTTVRASSIDASQNIYVLGDYSGTITIQGTPLAAYGGVSDIFLAKFNSSGILQWAVRAGSATGAENGMGMDIDASGNVYITGGFAVTSTFNDAGPVTVTSAGAQDVFIAKYNSSGVLQWVKNVASGPNIQRATDIIVDNNELIIIGLYTNSITFGVGDPLETGPIALSGLRDFFVAKYDDAGVFMWEHHYPSTSTNTNLTSIVKHDGIGYFIGGAVAGDLDFDDGFTTASSTLITEKDLLLFKVDFDGDFLWSTDVGNTNNDEIKDLKCDASGNIYSSGYIEGVVDFGGGVILTTASVDFFIAKRNSSGTLSWAINSEQAGTDQAYSMAISNNNTYIAGSFTGTIDIGDNQLISAGSTDIFVATFDNTGNPIDANSITGSGNSPDEGQSIVIDSKRNTYVSGYFVSPTVTANTTTLTNADATSDMFIAKYNWVVEMDQTDVSCNGGGNGIATATPIGGTAPYTYLWSDGQSSQTAIDLAAGIYSVTVTDFATTEAVDYVTITEPATALSLSTIVTHVVACPNNTGAIDLTISDGTSPYTQVWSSGPMTEDINTLVAGTYTVTVTDANGCEETTSATVECSDSWIGGTSDWSTLGNWTSGAVPTSTTNVVINAGTSPVISGNFECNDLTLNGGFSITIEPNASLIINGDASLNGDLTIESDNTGTGAFVNLGAFVSAGTHTVNRYLSTSEYHMVSSPIAAANLTLFTGEADLIDLLGYDEAYNTADWTDGWDNTVAGAMTVCRGYAAKFSSSLTIPYIGTVNAGAQNIAVTNTDGPEIADHEGWNLVGNPYPSPIDWDASTGWTKTNINDEIHFWDGTQYADYNNGSGTNGGTRFIPAMQGFMVKCNNAGGAGTLAMDNNVRVISTQSYWKSSVENELKLNLSSGSHADELVVRFMENADGNYETFDAYKMFSNVADIPNIYTLSDDERNLSINSFSTFGESKTVKLGYKVETAGNYTFNLLNSSFANDVFILIEDTQTGTYTNLSQTSSLSAYLEEGESTNRFLLHITKSLLIINPQLEAKIKTYLSNGNLNIVIKDFKLSDNYNLYIFDVLGREIFNRVVTSATSNIDIQNYHSSCYIVKVVSNKNSFTEKVFVE